ncbi:MAG: hypothetical protein ACL93V_16455 [Candidatus Electrothrix sp. YB6]
MNISFLHLSGAFVLLPVIFMAAKFSSRRILCRIEIPGSSARIVDRILSFAFFIIYLAALFVLHVIVTLHQADSLEYISVSPLPPPPLSKVVLPSSPAVELEIPQGKLSFEKVNDRLFQVAFDRKALNNVIYNLPFFPSRVIAASQGNFSFEELDDRLVQVELDQKALNNVIYNLPFFPSRVIAASQGNFSFEELDDRLFQVEFDQKILNETIHNLPFFPEDKERTDDQAKMIQQCQERLAELQSAAGQEKGGQYTQRNKVNIICDSMSAKDHQRFYDALHTLPINTSDSWTNQENKNRYTVRPINSYTEKDKSCRNYIIEAAVDGVSYRYAGHDCRISD